MYGILRKIQFILNESRFGRFVKSFDVLDNHIQVYVDKHDGRYYFEFNDETHYFKSNKKPTEGMIKSIIQPIIKKQKAELIKAEKEMIAKMEKKYKAFDFIEQLIIRRFENSNLAARSIEDATNKVMSDWEILNKFKTVKITKKTVKAKVESLINRGHLKLVDGYFGLTPRAKNTKYVKDLHANIAAFYEDIRKGR